MGSEADLLFEGGFPTSQPLFYTHREVGLPFSVRINSLSKMMAVSTAAVGHLLLSWRSDVHWSHLGKIEANKGSGLNSINV